MWNDFKKATRSRDKLSVVLKGPGWRPAEPAEPAELSIETGAVSGNHPDQGPLIESVKHAASSARDRVRSHS